MSEAHLLFSKDLNSLLLERMESEATFMLASLESLEIITEEAEEVVNNNAQKTASLWQHMKDFFKKIFNMFVEKTRQLTGKNKEWLDI
jgi:hypothetical protein